MRPPQKHEVGKPVMWQSYRDRTYILGVILEFSNYLYRVAFTDGDDDWFYETDVEEFIDTYERYQEERRDADRIC
jgi:hypothetical protein